MAELHPAPDQQEHAAGAGVLTPGRQQEKARLSREIDEGKVGPSGLDDPRR